MEGPVEQVDVLIVGSGPVGCTFAQNILRNTDCSVTIVEIGAQLSAKPGEHLKNSAYFQREINNFSGILEAHQHLLSVPSSAAVLTLDPSAFHFDIKKYPGYVQKGQNPKQNPQLNLPNAAATYAVGGMATHWTCCVPRGNAKGSSPELSSLIGVPEWEHLYKEAERLLNKNDDVFNESVRQKAILKALEGKFQSITTLPIAAERVSSDKFSVRWTGVDTVLGENNIKLLNNENSRFCIKSQHLCFKLNIDQTNTNKIESACIKDLQTGKIFLIKAKVFVIAAGAVLTPQLLYASNIRLPALGKYLCEQAMTFCQVVLSSKIVEDIRVSNYELVQKLIEENPNDPIPIPIDDPPPQIRIPVTEDHPFHCQIQREANISFYERIPPNVDPRLILDLRCFGRCRPSETNSVTFDESCEDLFGMPQPTFNFELSEKDSEEGVLLMEDMCRIATSLGGYLPGAEPKFMKPGTAVHITGTTRMGSPGQSELEPPRDCVVDTYSRVIGLHNLYVGGCGVIPTATACNPTLTAVALAVRASNDLIQRLSQDLK